MPVDVLYPNSTISATTWMSGSMTLHENLADGDEHVSASVVNSKFIVGFDSFNPTIPDGASFDGISSVTVNINWACMPRRDVFVGTSTFQSSSQATATQISGEVDKDYYGLPSFLYQNEEALSKNDWGLVGDSYTGTPWAIPNPLDSLSYKLDLVSLNAGHDGDGIADNTEMRIGSLYISVSWKFSYNPPDTYETGEDVKIEEGLVKIEEGSVKVK